MKDVVVVLLEDTYVLLTSLGGGVFAHDRNSISVCYFKKSDLFEVLLVGRRGGGEVMSCHVSYDYYLDICH